MIIMKKIYILVITFPTSTTNHFLLFSLSLEARSKYFKDICKKFCTGNFLTGMTSSDQGNIYTNNVLLIGRTFKASNNNVL